MDTESVPSIGMWDKIKYDYLTTNYRTTAELADKYGVSLNTLNNRIYKSSREENPWRIQKEELSKEVLDVAVQKSSAVYAKSLQAGVDVIEKALNAMNKALTEPGLKGTEAAQLGKYATDIVKGMQQFMHLATNKSTENIAVQHLHKPVETLKDSLKVLQDCGIDDE